VAEDDLGALALGRADSLWMVSGTFVLALMAGAAGLIVLSPIWWLSRPLWRQGHGARLRQMRSVEIAFKPTRSYGSSS
jgi:hypothetical protein